MLKPPFKLATSVLAGTGGGATYQPVNCCEAEPVAEAAPAASVRARLGDLDAHLHCSVLGTCLSTAELRRLMARFLFVRDETDLEIHHEAVRMAALGGPVTKALHKALDLRHDATLRRFARAADADALRAMWDDALQQGEAPGAYWAVLTHRQATPALRQKVFGDVHMLSHLVGAANRADIRRLVALEQDNAELRARLERQQQRGTESLDERDRSLAQLRRQLADSEAQRAALQAARADDAAAGPQPDDGAAARIALQTERRERAEQAAAAAADEAARLQQERAHLQRHADALARELAAAETQLRETHGAEAGERTLAPALRGRRILYVGGRPSSTPAIRDLVLRHGGEFQRHDGGFEDRKGLLSAAVGWAELVAFPVDCIDHDSAGNLKRLCTRSGIAYLPLRSASVASFAAALAGAATPD